MRVRPLPSGILVPEYRGSIDINIGKIVMYGPRGEVLGTRDVPLTYEGDGYYSTPPIQIDTPVDVQALTLDVSGMRKEVMLRKYYSGIQKLTSINIDRIPLKMRVP